MVQLQVIQKCIRQTQAVTQSALRQRDIVCVQEASSGKLEDQEVGDLVNGIDPQWVLVDRVIAQQEKQGMGSCFPCVAGPRIVCQYSAAGCQNRQQPMNSCDHHSWHAGSGMQYLVKWRGLGYDECTWEALSDLLPKFKSEIAKYKSQQPIALELVEQQKFRPQVHAAGAHQEC